MTRADLDRVLIIGNSGSGKTWLAKEISTILNQDIIHLDESFWEPGGFNKKRPQEVVFEEISDLALRPRWIMEGVFGELAEIAVPRATYLMFLDKTWEECEASLKSRGSESSKQMDTMKAEANFQELLIWAGDYWNRDSKSSRAGHEELFHGFVGQKARFTNRKSVEDIIDHFQECISSLR